MHNEVDGIDAIQLYSQYGFYWKILRYGQVYNLHLDCFGWFTVPYFWGNHIPEFKRFILNRLFTSFRTAQKSDRGLCLFLTKWLWVICSYKYSKKLPIDVGSKFFFDLYNKLASSSLWVFSIVSSLRGGGVPSRSQFFAFLDCVDHCSALSWWI